MSLQMHARAMTTLGLVMALSPVGAAGQQSTSRGLSIGLHALGTSLRVENGDENNGGGLGLRVGYGFNRRLTGFITIDGSAVDIPQSNSFVAGEWSMAHAEIGARFHFANSLRRWVPYLETSIGGRSVSIENARVNSAPAGKLSFNGPAVSVGTGLSVFVSRTWALDTNLRWTGGTFTEIDQGNIALRNLDIEAASFRFGIGVVWWP
jgi:Outer membrane protein beta-barrel domain